MPNGSESDEVRLTRLETQMPSMEKELMRVTAALSKLTWAVFGLMGSALIATAVALVNQL